MGEAGQMQDAVDQVRRYLMHRRFEPGDRLPSERDLATRLGMSRPTVRRAIARLVQVGLLEARQRSGTFLSDVDPYNLLEIRLLLEPYAAALASKHADRGSVSNLSTLLEAAKSRVDSENEFALADESIHTAVAELSGNPILVDVLAGLRARAMASRDLTVHSLDMRERTVTGLRLLVDSIQAGDSEAAQDAMRSHLEDVGQALARTELDASDDGSNDQPRSDTSSVAG